MPNRVKLVIKPSGHLEGVSYLIFRSKTPPVPLDHPVMTVNEKTCAKEIRFQSRERLIQDEKEHFYFHVSTVYQTYPMPQVYLNGEAIESKWLTFFPQDRLVRIAHPSIGPNTAHVVEMDYTYVVSVVEDDPTVEQEGVEHHGQEVITALKPPADVAYVFHPVTRSIHLMLTPDVTPDTIYYRLLLREDETGRTSPPSQEKSITLSPNITELTYELEKSADGGKTWMFVQEFSGTDITLTHVEDITSYAHLPLNVDIETQPKKAILRVQNPWYLWEYNVRPTHHYRIRAKDSRGQVSDWKIFAPGYMNYKPIQLKIRRKVHNGTPAQYEGYDAIDVWVLTEVDVDPAEPEIVLIDDHLVSGTTYSYTFYIDDEAGFRSLPFLKTTLIP